MKQIKQNNIHINKIWTVGKIQKSNKKLQYSVTIKCCACFVDKDIDDKKNK